MKEEKEGKLADETAFLIFEVQMSEKSQPNRLGSIIRYDKVRVGMQELFI